MHVNRVLGKQKVAVEKAQSYYLKEKGVFKEAVREMTWDLMSICHVPVAHIDSVIHTVAKGFGIDVKDSMDKHSASCITLEGQVTLDMQLVHEIHNTGGLTISGDGTTDKHLNYESKHGLLVTPTYSMDLDAPVMNTIPTQCFFSINAAVDHKSETQLQGWKDLVKRMYKVYNESPLGHHRPFNPLEFAQLVAGMNTDHAEDQKKLFRLFETWKASCKREMCGAEAILSASLADLIPLLWKEAEQNVADAGGLAGWEALSPDE
ncbi:hypothetical protein PILCRDRAFT_3255 [Piloderma croceum F 1598]|uniref:Uncharacterized protein n=1 Tax=Piloderma croceum (strain F 1598) TaxID=765440 RepID=A0A0C3GC46_PILCF|nr:hypothetical protein PILCRDRAFT_3255 [Piloderma croceum F 1598]